MRTRKEKDHIPARKELSRSTVGEEHRGTHRPVAYQVEGVSQANQKRRTQTWFTSRGFVSAPVRSTSDRVCKIRSACLVETLVGNVAKQRRNGALEIVGSDDCTLQMDFDYG